MPRTRSRSRCRLPDSSLPTKWQERCKDYRQRNSKLCVFLSERERIEFCCRSRSDQRRMEGPVCHDGVEGSLSAEAMRWRRSRIWSLMSGVRSRFEPAILGTVGGLIALSGMPGRWRKSPMLPRRSRPNPGAAAKRSIACLPDQKSLSIPSRRHTIRIRRPCRQDAAWSLATRQRLTLATKVPEPARVN